jgi:hypothetical protein
VASGELKPRHDLRVQLLNHRDGRRSYVVLDFVSGSVHSRADKFLSSFGEGTQRTYAYHLVDHLRWLAANAYREDSITIQDLWRYLALCGSQHHGPRGTPWRADPLGDSALAVRATCLKGYYVDLTTRAGERRAPRGAVYQARAQQYGSGQINAWAPRYVVRRKPVIPRSRAEEASPHASGRNP